MRIADVMNYVLGQINSTTHRKEEMGTVLEVRNITKSFVGNKVLDDVSLSVNAGEVHALVGENGAGKTTLMNIIGGVHQPDSGEIYLNGRQVVLVNPISAMKQGVSIVHQELSLVPNLNVAQNIFSNSQVSSVSPRQKTNRLGFIKWNNVYADTKDLLKTVGLEIDPMTTVGQLSVGVRQLLEIAKATSFQSKVLLLDEPTSSLAETEIEHLYTVIREFADNGVGIVFISHKLNEVFTISDRVSVLRDGILVDSEDTQRTTKKKIIQMMVGREIEDIYPAKENDSGKEIFRVENLTRDNYFYDISFSLNEGEILGFTGLVGSGRTDLARAIFAVDKYDSGNIFLHSEKLNFKSPNDAIEKGLCYLTEDRKNLGLFLLMLVRDNIVSASLRKFISKIGFLQQQKIKQESRRQVEAMDIRPKTDTVMVLSLSGGNQQKVLLAKWLTANPKVFIVDEPTRGVDVGAKSQIHKQLRDMANDGIGVIFISSELPEVLGMSDRIVVFRNQRISAILENKDITQEEVMNYATH